jgi:hypothetical protein
LHKINNMKLYQKLRELENLKDLLIEAEEQGKMIVFSKPTYVDDPYLIFYTA